MYVAPPSGEIARNKHRAVIAAMEHANTAEAERAMKEHIMETGKQLVSSLRGTK